MKTTKDLVDFLQSKQASDEEIGQTLEAINNLASAKHYAELLTILTKEEIEEANKLSPKTAADAYITEKFLAKTGKDPKTMAEEIVSDAVEEFIKNYKK